MEAVISGGGEKANPLKEEEKRGEERRGEERREERKRERKGNEREKASLPE